MTRTKLAGVYNIICGVFLLLISVVIIILLYTNNIVNNKENDLGYAIASVLGVIFLLIFLGVQLIDAVLRTLLGFLTVRSADNKKTGIYLKISAVLGFVLTGIYIFFSIIMFGFEFIIPAVVAVISAILSVAGIILNISGNQFLKKSV